MQHNHEFYLQEAIEEAKLGINQGAGGPFGCVIVKDHEIIGRGHNEVIANQDPTCHGEMQAIRDAAMHLKSFDLSNCILYTTAEPCPMCLGAILWANIKTIYYGCDVHDTESIGFRDDLFYKYLNDRDETVLVKRQLKRDDCFKVFQQYLNNPKRKEY